MWTSKQAIKASANPSGWGEPDGLVIQSASELEEGGGNDMRFAEDVIEQVAFADGNSRQVHIWEGEVIDTVLVAVHGGMAHGGDWVNVGQYFKSLGYATVAPDLHGHDKQKKVFIPSFDIFLDDLAIMISWVKQRYPGKPIILVGHSMGALIITHFGLRRLTAPDDQIVGVVLSSPYFVNAVKIPAIMETLSSIIASLAPNLKVPIEDFTDQLTHDEAITRRHKADAADDLRASEVSARFARELLVAQDYIPGHIGGWKHSLLTFVAGNDKLADSQESERLLGLIDSQLATIHLYPDNYHENFNETNRDEIFSIMHDWIQTRTKS